MSITHIVSVAAGDGSRPPVTIPDHTLLRIIGRGSYGEVWEARNVMGTPRAVKVVRRCDFDSARPFEREFEGIQRYEPVSRTDAGMVQVLHVGMAPEGDSFYYVMELADAAGTESETSGEPLVYEPKTLRSELHQHGSLPVEQCTEIGLTLASALGHLHSSGLVHRDVKPSNIIFVGGVPKLADVGLVARLSDTRSMVGTDGYFAPEGTGQPRSDVFSLGKVLYECITGLDRMRFPDVPESWGSGAETKAAFEFMEIVLRAAESNPERRYTDTGEMLADLALLKAGKSLRYLRRVETRLRRTLQVLSISALAIAVAGGAWFYERNRADQIASAERQATAARRETQRLLGESLVAEARAIRHGGQTGARERALDAVARGLEAGAPLRELRTEAASALALTDMGAFPRWDSGPAKPQRQTTSADGSLMATWTQGKVVLTNRDTGAITGTVNVAGSVADIVLSPDAARLAILGNNGSLNLWSIREGRTVWVDSTSGGLHLPAFSSDGTWIVFRSAAGLVARSSDTGSEPVVLAPGAAGLRYIGIAPDGKWIATLPNPVKSGDKETDLGFRIYTGLTGKMPVAADASAIKSSEIISDIRLEGPSISADGRYIAAAVGEDRLRVWEMPAMSQVAWVRGHQRSVRSTAFHPRNSSLIASSSWDGTTRLWSIPTRQELLVAPGGGDHIRLLPDRGEVVMRSWDGDTVRSASLSTKSALRVLMLPESLRLGLFSGLGFSPDGKSIAAAGDAGVVVWDLDSGAARTVRVGDNPQDWRDAVFDPSGKWLYYSGRAGLYRHAVVREAGQPMDFGPPEQVISSWCVDLDWAGDNLVICGLWNGPGKPVLTLLGPDGQRRSLPSPCRTDTIAVSASGRFVAIADYSRNGALWDLKQEAPAGELIESEGRLSFGFAENAGSLILGSAKDFRFRPLPGANATNAESRPRRNSEIIPGRSLQSPDGSLVALATGPSEITLCDGRTLEPLLALDSPMTPFDCVTAFSPDGSQLALAGGVSRVVIWDIAWLHEELARRGLGWQDSVRK